MDALARRKLAAHVTRFDTQALAAKNLGISAQYLGDLLKGRRTFSESILGKLGLKRSIQEAR